MLKSKLNGSRSQSVLKELNLPSAERVYSTSIYDFVIETDKAGLTNLRNDKRFVDIESDKIVALSPPCGTPRGGSCPPPDDYCVSGVSVNSAWINNDYEPPWLHHM